MTVPEIGIRRVRITDDFWQPRQRLMTEVTIPYMERILRDEVPGAEMSHAIRNFRMAAGLESGEFRGMVFQDSDVAKWLEAAAYSLVLKADPELESRVDRTVELIARCQQPDGYLNTYFTIREPENRWRNLLECHELYCAGHLMEAGVALSEAAGKEELLAVCRRLADHICDRFEREEGIPGHSEIEIGLMRMWRATGEKRYRDMALRFLDLRGQDPDWFRKHTPAHPGVRYGGYDIRPEDTVYNQSDMPVRRQKKARGHAVRQLYLLCAMADAAAETGDEEMAEACGRLFENITGRQMYLTGAVGASAWQEAFTVDFDLPTDRGYGETCASVAMAMFAHRMLRIRPEGRYADLLERELYNAALAGMQLDGKRFFYVNPLTVDRRVSGIAEGYRHVLPRRPPWHACACCPPNLARLIASLGAYLWSETGDTVYSHLHVGSEAGTRHGIIRCRSGMPWRGEAEYLMPGGEEFILALRKPAWAEDYTLLVNGNPPENVWEERGYCHVRRAWRDGDRVQVRFGMKPRRVYADPRVRDCGGRVALMRGPLVYCFEGTDQEGDLFSLSLPADAEIREGGPVPGLAEPMPGLVMEGICREGDGPLYGTKAGKKKRCTLRAIPYFAWGNREEGDMAVWIPEESASGT